MVECVEKREKIDEARFAIDLEAVNVAGTSKVSSHPCHLLKYVIHVLSAPEVHSAKASLNDRSDGLLFRHESEQQ